MSAERVAALRVRLPCADESDFYARLADRIAANGLRIPTDNPRPIGARVKVTLEFRNGGSLPGEAVVDARLEGGPRPVLNVRFVRFERAEAAAAQAPAPAPAGNGRARTASAGAAAAPPRAAMRATPAVPAAAVVPVAPAAPARAPSSAGAAPRATASLFEDVPDADPGDIEELEIADATADVAGPAVAVDAAPLAPSRAQAGARRRLVSRGLAIAVAIAVAIGWIGWSAVSRRPAPPPASPERSAADTHIAAADRRLSEARLIGADGALEHLLEARRLAPAHGGAARRLALLADTLEALGARALERGDIEEASVHLLAARDAAPERESIRTKLAAVASSVGSGAEAHRKRGTGKAGRNR